MESYIVQISVLQWIIVFQTSKLHFFPKCKPTFFQTDAGFCQELTQRLRSLPFMAIRFEMPHITKANIEQQPFEFVTTNAPHLSRRAPDQQTFQEHFQKSESDVSVFRNIGGDATLIAPKPKGRADFSHLLAFLRSASKTQSNAFWREVTRIFQRNLFCAH